MPRYGREIAFQVRLLRAKMTRKVWLGQTVRALFGATTSSEYENSQKCQIFSLIFKALTLKYFVTY